MKKLNALKKRSLNRETVGQLEEVKLGWVAGEGTTRTLCGDSGCLNSCLC